MTSAIKGSPNTYDFGESFNYSQWTENTTLTLLNVNWNNDYRDVWRASSQSAVDSWIDGNSDKLVIQNVSLVKFNQNVRINTPINKAMQHNYLRASNGPVPTGDSRRNYYYFILDYRQINPNTTELSLQLDVWQTYGYEVTLGNCFIERGHIGIANTRAFDNYGRDYLSIPEGLDVGAEYQIVKTARETVMDITGDDQYSVLVCTTVDISKYPGTEKEPKLYTAKGSIVDGIVAGAGLYIFPTPGDFQGFMRSYVDIPWVTQGIISITLIPNVSRYFPDSTLVDVAPDVTVAQQVQLPPTTGTADLGDATFSDYNFSIDLGTITVTVPGSTVTVQKLVAPSWKMYRYPSGRSTPRTTALAPDWRDSLMDLIPSQYQILKKLLTFPYSVVELTTWSGQPLVIRPEAWADPDATIREQAVMMPPSQRIAFIPYRYNASSETSAASDDDNGEYLDFATTLDNFPSVPLVNNMAISWMASNKNGLAFQFASADWSQQKALRGAQATSDIAGADIRNTSQQMSAANRGTTNAAQMQHDTAMQNMMLGAAGGSLGAISVAAAGAPQLALGQLAGVATSALEQANNANLTESLATNTNTVRSQQARASIEAQGSIRDTNVSLARFSAKGDYQNEVLGINAKIQDVRMTQPSTSGQFGGDAMNLAHSNTEVSARFKMIDPATMRRIGTFWLRYGYAVEQFTQSIPSDFQCMTKFTYWKMSETYITSGRIPEQFKQTIRGIFEKGVTVWADPAYIGTTSLSDNQPKTGITL